MKNKNYHHVYSQNKIINMDKLKLIIKQIKNNFISS